MVTKMSHWWRAYDDSVDHPKLCLLSDQAHRGWFNLCCVASANGGALPPMEELEIKLRLPKKKIEAIMAELKVRKLLDEADGVMHPHNWDSRQFKTDVTDPTNAERQRRYRKRHGVTEKTVTEGVTAKLPDTEAEKKDAACAALGPDLQRDYYARGKDIFGKESGGLLAKLLKVKKGNVALARAALEMASSRQDPREYIGAILAGGNASEEGRRLTNDEVFYGVGRTPGII